MLEGDGNVLWRPTEPVDARARPEIRMRSYFYNLIEDQEVLVLRSQPRSCIGIRLTERVLESTKLLNATKLKESPGHEEDEQREAHYRDALPPNSRGNTSDQEHRDPGHSRVLSDEAG